MTSGKPTTHIAREGVEPEERRESESVTPIPHRSPAGAPHQTSPYSSSFPAQHSQVPVERAGASQRPQQGLSGNEPVTQPHVFPAPRTTVERDPLHSQGSAQQPPNFPSNINAPNLSTYIHHTHHYTFNAPCTITQNPDHESGEGPIINTETGTYTYSHSEQRGWLTPDARHALQRTGRPRGGPAGAAAGPGHSQIDHARSTYQQQQSHLPHAPLQQAHPQPSRSNLSFASLGQHSGASPEDVRPHGVPAVPSLPSQPQSLPVGQLHSDPPHSIGARRVHEASLNRLPGVSGEPPPKRRNRSLSVPAFPEARVSSGPPIAASSVAPIDPEPLGRTGAPSSSTGHVLNPFLAAPHDVRTKSSSDGADPHRPAHHLLGGLAPPHGALQSSPIQMFASNPEQDNLNDWEQVVHMYLSGTGTPDGIPLKDYMKGGPQRVDDRKLLEKRRTIGKTYEKLGKERFERAIGYKIDHETGVLKKQKMYHVIARCRIVNALRKAGQPLPEDGNELERLISEKIQEKAESKHPVESSQFHVLHQPQQQHEHQHQPQHQQQQHEHQPPSQTQYPHQQQYHHQQHRHRQRIPHYSPGGGSFSPVQPPMGGPPGPHSGQQNISPLPELQPDRNIFQPPSHQTQQQHHSRQVQRRYHQGTEHQQNPRYPPQHQNPGPP